jgi:hypothetical protein
VTSTILADRVIVDAARTRSLGGTSTHVRARNLATCRGRRGHEHGGLPAAGSRGRGHARHHRHRLLLGAVGPDPQRLAQLPSAAERRRRRRVHRPGVPVGEPRRGSDDGERVRGVGLHDVGIHHVGIHHVGIHHVGIHHDGIHHDHADHQRHADQGGHADHGELVGRQLGRRFRQQFGVQQFGVQQLGVQLGRLDRQLVEQQLLRQ